MSLSRVGWERWWVGVSSMEWVDYDRPSRSWSVIVLMGIRALFHWRKKAPCSSLIASPKSSANADRNSPYPPTFSFCHHRRELLSHLSSRLVSSRLVSLSLSRLSFFLVSRLISISLISIIWSTLPWSNLIRSTTRLNCLLLFIKRTKHQLYDDTQNHQSRRNDERNGWTLTQLAKRDTHRCGMIEATLGGGDSNALRPRMEPWDQTRSARKAACPPIFMVW